MREKIICYGCGMSSHCGRNIEGTWYCEACSRDHYCIGCESYHKSGGMTFDGFRCRMCLTDYHICMDCGNLIRSNQGCHAGSDFLCFECYGNNYDFCECCCEIFDAVEISECGGSFYCDNCRPNNSYPTRCAGSVLRSDSFNEIESERFFGIEIETCDGDYDAVPDYWGIHYDGSITGMEIVSPILQGDRGLDEICYIYDSCNLEFDSSCGIHIHIDVTDLSEKQKLDLVKAFLATKETWFKFVDVSRRTNSYCEDTLPKLLWGETFEKYMSRIDNRYTWLNLDAYRKHGTFEIRLLEGCGYAKVEKWVKMILKFVEEVKGMACV